MTDRICLDVKDIYMEDYFPLIVSYKTGIFYTSRTGGQAMNSPMEEGFLSAALLNYEDINDRHNTPWKGYTGLYEDMYKADKSKSDVEKMLKAAISIDEYLISLNRSDDIIRFDFNRIHLFHEGWWPVVFNDILTESGLHNRLPLPTKGILCGWNSYAIDHSTGGIFNVYREDGQ